MLFRAWRVSYTLGRGKDGHTTVAGSDGALVDTGRFYTGATAIFSCAHRARRAVEYSLQVSNMFREAFYRRCRLRIRLLVGSC